MLYTLNYEYSCLVARPCPSLFAASWIVAHQAHLSRGFPRQEYWSGLPFPPPGDLSNTGIELTSSSLQVGSLLLSCQRNFMTMNCTSTIPQF